MIAIRSLRPSVIAVATKATTTTTTRAAVKMTARGAVGRCLPLPIPTIRRFAATAGVDGMTTTKTTATANTATTTTRRDDDGPPRTSVLMELTDRVGALHDVLRYL